MLVENERKKLQKFGAAYFRGKSHFEEDDTQNYLVFQPTYRCFKRIASVGIGNYLMKVLILLLHLTIKLLND